MENSVGDTVGAVIKRLRNRAGLSQGQLATYASTYAPEGQPVTRSWLSRVETGSIVKPEAERLQALARVLRVEPAVLLASAGYRVTPLPPPPERDPEEITAELQVALRRRRERERRVDSLFAQGGFADLSAEEIAEVERVVKETVEEIRGKRRPPD